MVGFVSPAPPQRRDAWTALMLIKGRCFFISTLATILNILKNLTLFDPKNLHVGTISVPLKRNQTKCKICTDQSVKSALFSACKCIIIQDIRVEYLFSIGSTYNMLQKTQIMTQTPQCGIDQLSKFYYTHDFKQQSIV